MLTAPFTEKEIQEAVFSMHPDKAPGPDRMNPAFFQRHWHIVGTDIYKECLSFISNCSIPEGLNDTHIVLIPKKKNVESTLSDLCNVIYVHNCS